MTARPESQGYSPRPDRFLAAVVIHAALRRGASRQELIDLGIRYKRLDFVKALVRDV